MQARDLCVKIGIRWQTATLHKRQAYSKSERQRNPNLNLNLNMNLSLLTNVSVRQHDSCQRKSDKPQADCVEPSEWFQCFRLRCPLATASHPGRCQIHVACDDIYIATKLLTEEHAHASARNSSPMNMNRHNMRAATQYHVACHEQCHVACHFCLYHTPCHRS